MFGNDHLVLYRLKRDERLTAAAMLHLKSGNIREYCDLMIELGQWERALAVAPGVSHGYWKDLTHRYATRLESTSSEAAVPFYVTAGYADKAINFYVSRKEYNEAFIIAKAHEKEPLPSSSRGGTTGGLVGENNERWVAGIAERKESLTALPSPTIDSLSGSKLTEADEKTCEPSAKTVGEDEDSSGRQEDGRVALLNVSELMAQQYFSIGEPIRAACCHLAVGDYHQAIEVGKWIV